MRINQLNCPTNIDEEVLEITAGAKVITLIQPWASLIAFSEKRIETRSWHTSYRGPLFIHAGKTVDKEACRFTPFKETLAAHGITDWKTLPTGVILARCNLVDCLTSESDGPDCAELSNGLIVIKNEYYFGDYTPGRAAWMLDSIQPLAKPVPAKGKLGLWTYKPEVTA